MGWDQYTAYERDKIIDQIRPERVVKNNWIIITPLIESFKASSTEITKIAYFVCFLSMLDFYVFAYPFSMTHFIQANIKFSQQQMLLSVALCFGFPTSWFLPHRFNKWFFKCPLQWLVVMRLLQALAFSIIIISLYTENYVCFCIGRVLHYNFLVGSIINANHLLRTCE